MRCDEIQDRFVELLYEGERGTPSASPELRAHVRSCAICRHELEELRTVRSVLGLWKDEAPGEVALPASARVVPIAGTPRPTPRLAAIARWGAIAAMLVMALLALGNAEMIWNRDGFAFRTRLLPSSAPPAEYYTKAEVRELVKMALDDTEIRIGDSNRVMIHTLLDALEQEKQNDLRYITSRYGRSRVPN